MIVGFELAKINVERSGRPVGNVKVKHNLNIDSVKELAIERMGKRNSLDVSFTFTVDYEPKLGNIVIAGSLIYTAEDAMLNRVISNWKSKKKVPKEASLEIVNVILTRCNIKSLELAEDVNLPYHMPLPKIEAAKQDYSNYIG